MLHYANKNNENIIENTEINEIESEEGIRKKKDQNGKKQKSA